MKKEKIKEGVIVLNKLNGKNYRIIAVENGVGTAEEEIVSSAKTSNGEAPDQVQITEKNAICFRLIRDPNPPETLTGFWEVRDGILYRDNVPATEQGQLKFTRLISVIPGALILGVETPGDPDREDVKTYRPDCDAEGRTAFFTVARALPKGAAQVVGICGHSQFLLFNSTEEVEIKDEDGQVTEKKQRFLESTLFKVWFKGCRTASFDAPIDGLTVIDKEHDLVAAYAKTEVDEDGFCIPAKDVTYHILTRELWEEDTLQAPGEARIVENAFRGGYSLFGDSFTIVNGDVFDVGLPTAKADHTFFVDLTREEDMDILTLANANYDVLKVLRKHTKDRGDIYSFETI